MKGSKENDYPIVTYTSGDIIVREERKGLLVIDYTPKDSPSEGSNN